jgi:hypothetical protein
MGIFVLTIQSDLSKDIGKGFNALFRGFHFLGAEYQGRMSLFRLYTNQILCACTQNKKMLVTKRRGVYSG